MKMIMYHRKASFRKILKLIFLDLKPFMGVSSLEPGASNSHRVWKNDYPAPIALPLVINLETRRTPNYDCWRVAATPVTNVNDRAERPLILLSPSRISLGTRRILHDAIRLPSAQVVASRAVWPVTPDARRSTAADEGLCDIRLCGAYDIGFLLPDFLVLHLWFEWTE